MPYKPKPVQNNYAKEIAKKTGTREDAVKLWLDMNEVDALTILQGIGSGRIDRHDFTSALLSDNGTLEFLRKYNSDGRWGSVWNAKRKIESFIYKTVKEKQQKLNVTKIISEGVRDSEFDELDNALFAAFKELNKHIKFKYPYAYKDMIQIYNDLHTSLNNIYMKHNIEAEGLYIAGVINAK